MSKFAVTQAKENELIRQMRRYGILEDDIEEKFIRGSGAGGQKINKTSSTVQLIHLPTGTRVKCQKTRSQSLNRFHARRLLVEAIVKQIEGIKSAEQKKREKIRRQKRRRSRRAKDKMLATKKKQADKKSLRRKPSLNFD